MEQREFSLFVRTAQVARSYPGAAGLAYIAAVPPAGRRSERFRTTFAEPSGSWGAVGLDQAAVPALRRALVRARATGRTTLTARFAFDRGSGGARAREGFALVLPVSSGGGFPRPAARQGALYGWLAARLDGAAFAASVLDTRAAGLRLGLYDDPRGEGRPFATGPAGRPARAGGDSRTARIAMRAYGRAWLLEASAPRSSLIGRRAREPAAALAFGAVLSILLAALIAGLGRQEARASRLVDETLERLRDHEERFRSVSASPIGIFHTDRAGRLLYTNGRWEEIAGLSREELGSRHWTELVHADDRPAVRGAWDALGRGTGELSSEFRLDTGGDPGRWVQVRASSVGEGGAGTTGYVGSFEDVTERRSYEEELGYRALHDPLTGLPNRALFLERLATALEGARSEAPSVAVLFLDLDRFKVVNDSLGHEFGDRVLVAVAQRLAAAIRPADTVARFGGDEFTLVCLGVVEERQAVAVAERIARAIEEPLPIDGREIFLTVSVGIALAGGPGDDPQGLLRHADAAMYDAKERGKARYEVFDQMMEARADEDLAAASELHRALGQREFRVHYQPMVSLRSGLVVGFEALVRWQHPERGLLLPGEFMQHAEETGLVVPLGTFVLSESCRQVARWRQDADGPGPPPCVSVNLSGRELADPLLPETIAAILHETGVDPAALILEITENVVIGEEGTGLDTLVRLKALGVGLSFDDFGTGYSSLSYLKRFPVDMVKIDRSFVAGLGRNPDDGAIVAAIVGIARSLGLTVVAEGVETAEQLSELVALDCELAQGFAFAPAEPPGAATRILHRREPWLPPVGAPAR